MLEIKKREKQKRKWTLAEGPGVAMLMLFSFLKSEAFHLPVAASLMSTQRLTVEERERPSFHNAISSDRLKRFTDSLPAEAKTWRRRSIAILFLLLLSVLFFFRPPSLSVSFFYRYIYIYIYIVDVGNRYVCAHLRVPHCRTGP